MNIRRVVSQIDRPSGKQGSCFAGVFTSGNVHVHVAVMNAGDSRLHLLCNRDTEDCKRR